MSKTRPTRIEIDTQILSTIVSAILAEIGAPSTKKSACLNIAARHIAGVKHNWGYLTGSKTRLVAQGLKQNGNVFDQPDYVIAGATLALQDHPLTPPNMASDLAPLVAGIYINELPAALEVFTTTKEVYNDLVHNRSEIIGFIAGQAHRSDQLNREVRSALHDVGITNTPAPEMDPSRSDRPWPELLCDILKTPSSVPHAVDEDENAPNAFSGDLDWEMDDLISFMRADDRFHPAVCEYMRQNAEAVGAAIQAGQETPAGWQRIAKIASTLDLSQGRHVELTLITLAEFHLPVHAHALIEYLKQES